MRSHIDRTITMTLGMVVVLYAGVPGQLFANCEDCDALAACYSEPASDWCQCSTKVVGGEQICLVKDPGCQSPAGCGGPATLGPVRLRPTDSPAFEGFEEREPLLAGVLIVATRQNTAGHCFPTTAAIVKGTMAGVHGSFRYHGAFFPRSDGLLGFIVDLDGSDRSNLVFSGVIEGGGLQVSYTKTRRTAPDARPESERVEWSAPQ